MTPNIALRPKFRKPLAANQVPDPNIEAAIAQELSKLTADKTRSAQDDDRPSGLLPDSRASACMSISPLPSIISSGQECPPAVVALKPCFELRAGVRSGSFLQSCSEETPFRRMPGPFLPPHLLPAGCDDSRQWRQQAPAQIRALHTSPPASALTGATCHFRDQQKRSRACPPP